MNIKTFALRAAGIFLLGYVAITFILAMGEAKEAVWGYGWLPPELRFGQWLVLLFLSTILINYKHRPSEQKNAPSNQKTAP